MKIAVVSDVLGEENNGTTIAAMNLIRSLRAKGHEVRVVCPDVEKTGEPGYYIVKTLNAGPLNGYVAKNGVSIARPDKKVIKKALKDIDVVHIMVPFLVGCYVAKYCNKHGIPLSAGFHCQAENFSNHLHLMNAQRFNNGVYKFFYKHMYQYCDAIHYPTQFICNTFENVVGMTPHHVISNGVNSQFNRDIPRHKKNDGLFRILYIGRYSKEKTHSVLLKAVNKSKYRNRIQLIFAGDGPQKKKLQIYAAKHLPIQAVMKFYSRKELLEVIGSADLYVHAAEIELESISCLEAISCGLVPVINNSPRSATKYFALDNKNLFKCNNPKDLAAKIDYWIEHPEEKEQRSLDYADFAKQWQFDQCMDQMEEMILSICHKDK